MYPLFSRTWNCSDWPQPSHFAVIWLLKKKQTYLQRSNIAISKSKDMWTNTNLFCWPHFLLVYECGMSFVLFSYGTGSRNYRSIEKAFHVRLLDSGCMSSFLTESCWSNHRFLSISFIWFVREIKGRAEVVVEYCLWNSDNLSTRYPYKMLKTFRLSIYHKVIKCPDTTAEIQYCWKS